GGTDGDDLVRVDALVRLLAAGELADHVGDGGHAGGATDEDDVVDVADLDARVLDHLVERRLGALEQVRGHRLELGAGQLLVELDSSFLACSAASRSRCIAILSFDRSTPVWLRTVVSRCWTIRLSQSSPPRLLSPWVARTWIVENPSSGSLPTSSSETSKVPPPRSKTRMSSSSFPLSSPYARAAAVGSLTMRSTLRPAISPASFVA